MAEVRQPKSVDEAMKWLRDGNANYVNDSLQRPLQDAARRKTLAKKQNPWAIVLTCADSRVTPELVFDCGIGELFIVRLPASTTRYLSCRSS